jgi:hypothetical protein
MPDRGATIRSVLKVVYFLHIVWSIFLYSHTQPDQKQDIKNLPTTLVPSLTLQRLTSFCHVTKHRDVE